MSKVKYIPIDKFRAFGFLQELNRQFLHPLGLALEVVVDDDGQETLGGVWDYRDDPEGMAYAELDEESAKKAQRVEELRIRKAVTRRRLLGFEIQPVGSPDTRGGI